MLSLHPLKRMDQERMEQERMEQERMEQDLVWVNPGSFGEDASGKTDGAAAVAVSPGTPVLPVANDEPQPQAVPAATSGVPEEASVPVAARSG